jgi:hypothetical protein
MTQHATAIGWINLNRFLGKRESKGRTRQVVPYDCLHMTVAQTTAGLKRELLFLGARKQISRPAVLCCKTGRDFLAIKGHVASALEEFGVRGPAMRTARKERFSSLSLFRKLQSHMLPQFPTTPDIRTPHIRQTAPSATPWSALVSGLRNRKRVS